MCKKLFITIAFILSALSLSASTPWLKRPLRFVNPDSVLVWGYDGRDCRSLAMKCNKDAGVYPILLTQKEWNDRKHIYKEWRLVCNKINAVGGFEQTDANNTLYGIASILTRAMQLFRMQGDAQYVDYAERALYNIVMHTVNDSTLLPGSIEQQLAANLLFTQPGLIYATSPDNDVYVNIYTNSTASVHTGNLHFTLDQITDMPLNGSVKLRFNNLKANTPIRLHLRMPDWLNIRANCAHKYVSTDSIAPSLFVNGHEIEHFKVDEKGYVVIDRTWNALDEVYLDIPLQMQRIVSDKANGKAQDAALIRCNNLCWQFGPLVYQLQAPGYVMPWQQHPLLDNELSASGFPTCKIVLLKEPTTTTQQGDGQGSYFRLMPYADATNAMRETDSNQTK